MSCCTATMSARGTMTLSIRHSRRPRIFFSMRGFFGREARLRLLGGQHEFEIGARRRGLPAEQDAHDARQPALRRLAGSRHDHRQTAMLAVGRFAARRGLGHRLIGSGVWLQDLSEFWRTLLRGRRRRLGPHADTDRGCEPPQNFALGLFHRLAPPRRARDRSRPDAGNRAPPDGRHDGRTACARRGPRARWFHRRARCRRDAAARRRLAWSGTTARWWPRRCRANAG